MSSIKIQTRRVYFLRYRNDDGNIMEVQFSTRAQAIIWLNRAILDAGRYDAKIVTRNVSESEFRQKVG